MVKKKLEAIFGGHHLNKRSIRGTSVSPEPCGEAEARIGTISPLDENSRKFQCWHWWFHSHTVRKYNSRWVLSKTGLSVQEWSRGDCVQERALMSLGLVWGNVVSRHHGCGMKNVKIAGAAMGFQKLSQGPVGRSVRWRERKTVCRWRHFVLSIQVWHVLYSVWTDDIWNKADRVLIEPQLCLSTAWAKHLLS